MSDLAKIAGVSTSTVSRALAGSELINPETRDKIRKLASEYNYRLDINARNLRLKNHLSIGVLIPSSDKAKWQLSDPFFLEMIGNIAESLSEKDHDMVLSHINLHDRDWVDDGVRQSQFDGLIVIGQSDIHSRLNDIAGSFPNITVWGAQLPDKNYCTVGTDNRLGGELAVSHLIEQGSSKVLFLGNRAVPEDRLRYAGYCDAYQKAGLVINEALSITSGSSKEEGYAAIQAAFKSGIEFDAVFAASDALAIAVISGLSNLGVTVPDDVLVVGYDDITIAAYYTPAITTVRQDRALGGSLLVNKLLKKINGDPVESQLIPTELIIRDSSRKN